MWLKEAGYATACYGKWNVGEVKDVSWPGAHGFDDWLIIDHNTGYFQHQNKNPDCQGREMLFGTGGVRVTSLRGKYLTDIWTDKALEFINANTNKPFFLYLPFAVPHSPLQDPADPSLAFDEQPKATSPEGRAAFVKMVEYLDSRIGKILGALEERGLIDNTMIMFTSDNGGMRAGNCWPLKKQKQWLEEGGIRVPCLMQWPGVIPPGTVSAQPSIMMDASVTMLAAGGALKRVPPARKLDGMDLLPILQGNAEPVRDRVLGWRRRDWSPNFNSLRQEAFRAGDWKLLRTYRNIGKNERSAEPTVELFNLANDISEATNLAQANPEKFAAMQAAFDHWQQEVVEQKPDYLIPVPDQLGSPAKYPPVSMLFDFKRDRLGGHLLTRNNETRISETVIRDGVFNVRLSPGLVHPTPLLFRDGAMATTVFSAMRVRMKVTVEDGGTCGPARALLRHDQWKGKDIPFEVHADGEWHEYVIDVTQSPAWSQWTPRGRIGMVMPEPDKSPVTVEIDFIELEPSAESPPNFVFMFADDLGYRDLACYGHPYAKTPTLDKLASEGTQFTQAYAAGQTCSPSRTGVMTGLGWPQFPRSPARFGFGDRVTITELLNKAGYATGHFGKWHIGPIKERAAGVYGVDEYDRCGPIDIHRLVPPEGRDAPIYEKAVEFIKKNKDRPFYVNVWGFSTHYPVVSHPNHLAEFKDAKINPADFSEHMRARFRDCIEVGGDLNVSMRHYLANVYALDRNVASLLKAIDDLGLRDNTVVVFSSDQGPAVVRLNDGRYGKEYKYKEGDENMLGDTGPFRGTKHTVLEGGLRIPFIIRWPGKVKAGRVDDSNVIGGVDWLPSICKLAGVEAPADIAGEDVSDMWLGAQRARRKPLFWRGHEGLTIRDGKWRYYRGRQGDELYDLSNDPGEARNLAQQHPEVAASLRTKALAWEKALPTPPPINVLFDFDYGSIGGALLTRNNETRVSEPVIRDGVFSVRLSPGLAFPTPLLFRDRGTAITAFSTLRIRMRVTVEDGGDCGPAGALLRNDGWKGEDIPFDVHADGQWHEYVIDVTQSPAWSKWTRRGRLGMVMPEPAKSPITVDIDFIKLEKTRRNN